MRINLTTRQYSPNKSPGIVINHTNQKEIYNFIEGVVLSEHHYPVKDAVVELFEVIVGFPPIPVTHTFTDGYGKFRLESLTPGKRYILKFRDTNVTHKIIAQSPSDHKKSNGIQKSNSLSNEQVSSRNWQKTKNLISKHIHYFKKQHKN